jgi:hypothetical protein
MSCLSKIHFCFSFLLVSKNKAGLSPGGPKSSVSQTVVHRALVVCGGLPDGPWQSAGSFRRKIIAKVVSNTERMESFPIHVCAKTAFVVDIQRKVGKFGLSITSGVSIIVLENT